MAKFDKEILENLEKFSCIKCTPEEEPALLEALQKILKYMDQLEEIDTENVPECNFVQQDLQQNIYRKDEMGKTIPTILFLSNAPEKEANMVKVPPVLT
jgi:aspartyl-tRNA(Asn)/glutamyl-tRNA(Gln) amidotransferase subunit C